jgi:hypothetical protein
MDCWDVNGIADRLTECLAARDIYLRLLWRRLRFTARDIYLRFLWCRLRFTARDIYIRLLWCRLRFAARDIYPPVVVQAEVYSACCGAG